MRGSGGLLRNERGIAALEFALLAPALLMLVFAVMVYSLYFSTLMGVRQAAVEGARAAVAGLSTTERSQLARDRAQAVIGRYGSLLSSGGGTAVTVGPDGTGLFRVQVSHDMRGSPIMRYAGFLPMPSPNVTASSIVTNGSY